MEENMTVDTEVTTNEEVNEVANLRTEPVVIEDDHNGGNLGAYLLGAGTVVLLGAMVTGGKKAYKFIKGKINDKKAAEEVEVVAESEAMDVEEQPVEAEVVEEPKKTTSKKK